MKKSTILAVAALAGVGAALAAPSAVSDPRLTVPFPVSAPLGPTGEDGIGAPRTA